ncbi:MAG: choline-sulfatase [Gammaproteobacteria bacterium]|nr:choline-sulfatase [Gammaproteobacteria bacterium]
MTAPPNIVMFMADQLASRALPVYGHPVVKTPHVDAMAARGVVFDNCYAGFPLCAPSRFSMLSGQLGSTIGAWDNAAEFPSEIPTVAHYLRLAGYSTCLSGKMHFVGADQQHGFEERLTTDVCPSDFSWTATWDEPERVHEWFHTMKIAASGGLVAHSLALDFDEESTHQSLRRIYQWARQGKNRPPFFLLHSMTHPHDPYVTTRQYWDRYRHEDIDLPAVPWIPPAGRDPHSRRLFHNYDRGEYKMDDEKIRNARHAYYGGISFMDDQIGKLTAALADTGLLDNTVLLFTSDHGDMLGERGLWYKMSFYEGSIHVPLVVSFPRRFAPRRVGRNVSLLDLMPTLVELGGGNPRRDFVEPVAGRSLAGLLKGEDRDWDDVAVSEYLGEATPAPYVMVRRGPFKYTHCDADPPQLFNLEDDPHELNDLAADAGHAKVRDAFAAEVRRRWNFGELAARILLSQRRRTLTCRALSRGRHTAWDYGPPFDASQQYHRGHLGYRETEDRDLLPYPGGGKT